MMPVSPLYLRSLNGSHKRKTVVTCTPPGGDPVELKREPGGSTTGQSKTGAKYGANLSIIPVENEDTFELVRTPGAIFNIKSGIQYGVTTELTDCFTGELAAAPEASIFGEPFDLTLADQWIRIKEARFTDPYSPPAGTRAATIAAAVLDAIPTAIIDIRDDGGMYTGGKTWDRDRDQMIVDLATDGSLECGFDPAGVFVIKPIPILDPTASVWTFRSGTVGNILSALRVVPLGSLYNRVVVLPSVPTQTWSRQIVDLQDVNNPRHQSKIGIRPYFWASPTAASATAAFAAGEGILQRLLAGATTLRIGAVSNPALEPGDVVTALQEETMTDPGFTEVHILDQFQLELDTFQMSSLTRSSTIVPVEEG